MKMKLLIFPIVLFLCSCGSNHNNIKKQAHIIPKVPINTDAFNADINNLITIQQIFSINQKQKSEFLAWYNDINFKDDSGIERIYDYLKDRLEYFNYHSDTLIAQDTLEKNTGNCLSLAILTKSLARLVDIKVDYELVNTPTIFQKENEIIINSKHIRTVLNKKNNANTLYLSRNKIRIDYFPVAGTQILRKVNDDEFYSMYYNNKAVEYLINNDINNAYLYSMQSLKLNPINAEAVSMLGILHARLGYPEYAERIYLYGLSYSKDEEILLKNYYTLLTKQKRVDEANIIYAKLEKYQTDNPFELIEIADKAYLANDYSKALRYYKKATKNASYLHEAYAGIARSYYHLGKSKAASNSMLTALDNSHQREITRRYQTKYEYFKSLEK